MVKNAEMSLTNWQCESIFIRLDLVTSQKCEVAKNFEKSWIYSSSRSSKVDEFGTNRKRICGLLAVRHSNLGHNLRTFLRYGDLLAKNCLFLLPLSHSAPPLPIFPLEFCSQVNHKETRVMGLLCGKSCSMILTSTVFDWSTHVMMWQTDGRTDRRTGDSI